MALKKGKIVSKKLNMTLEQMENEIEMMRAFDKWLLEVAFGKQQYARICKEFAHDTLVTTIDLSNTASTYSAGHNEEQI